MVLVGNALYLEQPGGGAWLKFVPKHRPADVYDLLTCDIQCKLLLRGGEVSLSEFLTKDGELELRELLNPDQVQMRPLSDWDQTLLHSRYDGDISIDIDDMDFTRHCHLRRRETDWLLVYQDEAFSGSAWTFESAALDAFIAARQAELDQGTGLFSDFATADRPICLDYDTYTMQDVSLRCAVPGSSLGGLGLDTHWERQTHTSFTERTIHIQCRPYGRADWMDIWYYFSEDAAYSSSLHQSQSIGLASGASGTVYHADNPERWDVCRLGTAAGQLVARKNGSNDWTDEEHRMATAIMGTIQLWQKGTSLLGDPNPLGITLSAENVTPSGLTLVCTQDGTPWGQITTGAVWSLEQLTEEGWVSVMPEDTYWTSIAYLVPQDEVTRWNINWSLIREALPPGTYRVGKHFSATPVPPPWLDAERESVEQNSYAEFVIE